MVKVMVNWPWKWKSYFAKHKNLQENLSLFLLSKIALVVTLLVSENH